MPNSNNITTQNTNNELNINEDSLDQNQQIQKLLFRILPFWPLILLTLLLGFLGARLYLRYATKIYEVKARVIVNDDSQQKSANLVDIVQLDTRNMSTETEKEMEILGSRNLLSNLVKNLELNLEYGSKGYIKSGQSYKDLPFKLQLEKPDSISRIISGDVQIVKEKIHFNGVSYPCDTFIQSNFGKIKWHINGTNLGNTEHDNDWYVKIHPVATTVSQIQQFLTIEPISKQSSILELTYDDAIPDRGLNILDNLLSLYGSTTIDYKSRISENTLRFLDERLQLVSGELGGIEKNLQDFKTTNDIVDLGAQGAAVLGRLNETDTKISELDVQIDVLNKIQEYVTRRNDTNNQIPATLGITDPVLMQLLNQLYQAEFDLQKILQTSGPKNPKIVVLQETINKLKPSVSASINNLKTGLQMSRSQLHSDNDKLNSVINRMPVKERQLLDISRQQGIKNGIYTFLLQKREEAAIAASGIVANYRVIDKPELAGMIKPNSSIVYAACIAIAFIIVFIYIYFKEFYSTRLKFRSQIESRTKVPIIAEITFQSNKATSPVVVEEGKRSRIAEEFRELRTSLSYITFNSAERSKVILITSSIPNEGKSFVSINTAITLCLTGKKVVLLEFDLRKPKISKELDINRDPGLSTYFIGKATAKEIIQPHATIANFSIVPSGPIPPNPSELLSSSIKLNELFEYLKQYFDYIIIDSPPVGSVTDAKILANSADATLYIIRQNYTDSSFLQLINSLQQNKILLNLNIVFNGIKVKNIPGYAYGKAKYGYGYSYGYGYGIEKVEKKNMFERIFKRKKE